MRSSYPNSVPCGHPRKDTEWDIDEIKDNTLEGHCLRCGESMNLIVKDKRPTFQELKDIARRSRNKFDKPGGNCLKISTYIMSALHRRGVPAKVNETRINGNKHYYVICLSNGGDKVLIDASRDQFDGYNKDVFIEYR